MISIKECSPNWELALEKHVTFMLPRIHREIDYYINLLQCIEEGFNKKLSADSFLKLLIDKLDLKGSGKHSNFRSKANKLFDNSSKKNIHCLSEYKLLLDRTNLNNSLQNPTKMIESLKELRKNVESLLRFEYQIPYKEWKIALILHYLFTENISFLYDEIFDYEGFSKIKPNEDWGPYQLLKKLEIKVCPYCNQQYTFTIQKGNEKIFRPDLDHFLAKNETLNKLLQVSFFNLIPSCLVCNQRLKNDEKMDYTKHLSPYEKNEKHKYMRFDYIPNSTSGSSGDSDDFSIKIYCDSLSKEIQEKVEGNKKIFKLELIYNEHKDIVKDLIWRKENWDNIHIELTKKSHPGLNFNEEDRYRLLSGNHFLEKDFAKRSLSKLTKDIFDKLEKTKK